MKHLPKTFYKTQQEHHAKGSKRTKNQYKKLLSGRVLKGKAKGEIKTADEITTAFKSHLLELDSKTLKLGTITETKEGFTVTILAKDDSLIKRLKLNKSGRPMRKERGERKQKVNS